MIFARKLSKYHGHASQTQWFIHLWAYGLRKGDEHPAYTPVWVCGTLYLYISSANYYNISILVAVSEGKTLFFRAGNWSTSADGSWTVMDVLLYETFWFADNSTTSPAAANDLQGDSCFVFNAVSLLTLLFAFRYAVI